MHDPVEQYRRSLLLVERAEFACRDSLDDSDDILQAALDATRALRHESRRELRSKALEAHAIDPAEGVTRPIATEIDGALVVIGQEHVEAPESVLIIDLADVRRS